MTSYHSVQERRNAIWLKNAIRYRCMRLFPRKRDKKLWVFSAWEGNKYADNAKYLFEYVAQNHPEIKCVWQTKSQRIFEQLRVNGFTVQLIGTMEAELTQKKAGVAVYTNGLDDFGDYPFIYGAKLVSVWHGVGLKKIYRAQLSEMSRCKLFLSNLKWDFFSWVKRDLTIITSEYHKKQCIEEFHLKNNDKFYLAGQARDDVFARKIDINEVFVNEELKHRLKGKKIILYMPTFRENNDVLLQEIERLYKSEDFKKILIENNAVFLGKLHYLCRGNIQSNEHAILLNDEDVIDSQKLLKIADILITDYSSCAIDYALLRRPILFYFPKDGYDVKKWMMKDTTEICSTCKAETEKECMEKIAVLLKDGSQGIGQSNMLNEIFNEIIDIGSYSERTYYGICELLDIAKECGGTVK